TSINTRRLCPTSRLVSRVTGIHVQRNKAIVGQNAFAHEAGIHQDGMLKERSTYEIMNPEDVGLQRTELVLGKHSGRHALRQRVRELGYHLDEAQLQKVFEGFKVLADRKKDIFDADIDAQGEAHIEAAFNDKSYRGRGVSTDIIEASALAFLQVVNRVSFRRQPTPQVVEEMAPTA